MLSIATEKDPEALRQAALLLEAENERLHQCNRELQKELAELTGADAEQLYMALLQELESRQKTASPETETETESESGGDDESAASDEREKKTRKGHGPREQRNLPVQEVLNELGPEERECPACGGELEPMGTVAEESEVITTVRRQFVLQRHRCQKYRCRCNGAVVTAPGPTRLRRGGRYSVEFGVDVAVSKYLDHIPLERQVRAMSREGLEIDSQTLFDQIASLSKLLVPSYERIGEQVLDSPLLHVDETRWPLLDRRGSSPHSVFGLVTADAAYYRIPSSKSLKAARKILGEYRGTVVADGYQVYTTLSRAGPFRLAHCWAHVKRKFSDLENQHPQACARMLGLVRALYDVEREVNKASGSDDMRQRARRKRSRPIIKKIRAFCYEHGGLPRSGLGRATRYVLNYWDGLTLFLHDPAIPLDNNAVERALRGPVIGRKNHYGSKSRRGTRVAAILYTLCETAKLCGVDPWRYLWIAGRRAVENPGAVTIPQPGGTIRTQ